MQSIRYCAGVIAVASNGADPITRIPDEDKVFRRIPMQTYIQLMQKMMDYYNISVAPNLFALKLNETGYSVDWARYSSPEETQTRYGNPEKYGVLSLSTKAIRNIKPLDVIWTPIEENKAHSEIIGFPISQELKTTIRQELAKIASIIIPVPQ